MKLAPFLILSILALFAPIAFAAPPSFDGWSLFLMFVKFVLIALIFYAVWWYVGYLKLPDPFNKILLALVGLAALAVVVYFVMQLM